MSGRARCRARFGMARHDAPATRVSIATLPRSRLH
jgi:hypothetical protein